MSVILSALIVAITIVHMDALIGMPWMRTALYVYPIEEEMTDNGALVSAEKLMWQPDTMPGDVPWNRGESAVSAYICCRFN